MGKVDWTGGERRVEFVAKGCEVEIESYLAVNSVSQKLPKSGRVVSEVGRLGT